MHVSCVRVTYCAHVSCMCVHSLLCRRPVRVCGLLHVRLVCLCAPCACTLCMDLVHGPCVCPIQVLQPFAYLLPQTFHHLVFFLRASLMGAKHSPMRPLVPHGPCQEANTIHLFQLVTLHLYCLFDFSSNAL